MQNKLQLYSFLNIGYGVLSIVLGFLTPALPYFYWILGAFMIVAGIFGILTNNDPSKVEITSLLSLVNLALSIMGGTILLKQQLDMIRLTHLILNFGISYLLYQQLTLIKKEKGK